MPSPSRRSFLASAVAGGLAAAAGCLGGSESVAYRSYGYGSQNLGWNADASGPTAGVEVAWRFEDATPVQSPVVVDGRVIVATPRRESSVVAALDVADGTERWTYDAGRERWRHGREAEVHWTPAVVDGTVYATSQRGLGALREPG
jgi:outer membrane protein assembly factor BamB